MIRNYYTLKYVAKSLKEFIGYSIVECFSQDRDSLIIYLSDGNDERPVEFIGTGANDTLYVKSKFNRAKKNTIDLMDNILDEVIQNVEVLNNDRVIRISLIHTDLFIVLFGGKKSNVYAVNRNGVIIDSFKNPGTFTGTGFSLPKNPVNDFLSFDGNYKVIDALSKSEFQLGKLYADEILTRNGTDKSLLMKELSNNEKNNIKKNTKFFIEEISTADCCYIYEINNKFVFSLTSLTGLEAIEEYKNINYGIQRTVILREKRDSFQPDYKRLNEILLRLHRKYQNQVKAFEHTQDSQERIEKYKLYGDILSSLPNPNEKCGTATMAQDWEGNSIEIPLDDKLTIIANAEKYYNKARKGKAELNIRKKRLPEIERNFDETAQALEELSNAQSLKDLESFKIKYKTLLGLKMQNEPKQAEDKFRVFDLGEGYNLYVGKNASNNDELTMKFARPNDMWFHARGTSGSHAVLRIEKGQKPPKYIIKKACEISAYYSGQKNAGLVPVAYTFKKYVRKPKGAHPGSVVISKEMVEMVKPRLSIEN